MVIGDCYSLLDPISMIGTYVLMLFRILYQFHFYCDIESIHQYELINIILFFLSLQKIEDEMK